jgi:hypothetical protein
VHQQTGKTPSKLQLEDLNATTIAAFLGHLETERGNSVRTRKRTPDRDPLVLPLRRPGIARSSTADRPRTRHPREAVRHNADQLPRRARDRRAAGQPQSHHLDRPARPRAPTAGDTDRSTSVRAREPPSPRPPARDHRLGEMRRQRQERTVHAAQQTHPTSAPSVAARTRW